VIKTQSVPLFDANVVELFGQLESAVCAFHDRRDRKSGGTADHFPTPRILQCWKTSGTTGYLLRCLASGVKEMRAPSARREPLTSA
jgi:hypothetical protein